ncbi:MAG TPA: PH domain-containing protein [Naasia sp.]
MSTPEPSAAGAPEPRIAEAAEPATPAAPAAVGRLADGEWHRLHPATPLLRGGIAFVAILGVLVTNFRDRLVELAVGIEEEGDPFDFLLERGLLLPLLGGAILIIGIGILGFWLSWRFNRFRITDEVVDVRSGILFRTQRQARLDRIQGVNITRPLIPRLFGAARLEISVAGQDANVRLSYLRSDQVDGLRRDVLTLASGAKRGGTDEVDRVRSGLVQQRVDEFLAPELDPTEAEPDSIVRIPPGRLIGSIVLNEGTLVLILALAIGLPWALSNGAWYALIGAFPAVLGMASYVVNRFTRSLRYSIAGTPNGVRVGYGLLTTSNQTLPPGRIHAVAVRQPLLWRPAGWWTITINIANSSSSSNGGANPATTVLPVGTRDDVFRVLGLLLPELSAPEAAGVVATGLEGKGGDDGFVNAPARAVWLLPFSWRRTGFTLTRSTVLLRTGRIWRSLVIVPQARLQSVSLSQGPIRRALGVAGVHPHTVTGPVGTRLTAVGTAQAVEFFEDVAAAAVTSGEADTTHRWRAAGGVA